MGDLLLSPSTLLSCWTTSPKGKWGGLDTRPSSLEKEGRARDQGSFCKKQKGTISERANSDSITGALRVGTMICFPKRSSRRKSIAWEERKRKKLSDKKQPTFLIQAKAMMIKEGLSPQNRGKGKGKGTWCCLGGKTERKTPNRVHPGRF